MFAASNLPSSPRQEPAAPRERSNTGFSTENTPVSPTAGVGAGVAPGGLAQGETASIASQDTFASATSTLREYHFESILNQVWDVIPILIFVSITIG
jgi:hypothetical protein